ELGGVGPAGGGRGPDLEEERPRFGRDAVGVVVVCHSVERSSASQGARYCCQARRSRPMSPLAAPAARSHVAETWAKEIVPALCDFIRIPNISVAFDPGWSDAGHMARAVALVADWLRARPIEGATVEVQELPGRTPVVLVDVPAHGLAGESGAGDGGSVLLYGHLDKQPPLAEWRTGLGPWEPVREGERLYGRGGGDDGYAAFAALSAIEAVRAAGGVHRRCVVLIEASEESGSPDLPSHLGLLGDRLAGTD